MYDDRKVDKDIFSNLKKKEGTAQSLFPPNGFIFWVNSIQYYLAICRSIFSLQYFPGRAYEIEYFSFMKT